MLFTAHDGQLFAITSYVRYDDATANALLQQLCTCYHLLSRAIISYALAEIKWLSTSLTDATTPSTMLLSCSYLLVQAHNTIL